MIRTQAELYGAIIDNYEQVRNGKDGKDDTFLWYYLQEMEIRAASQLDPTGPKGRASKYRRLLSLEMHRQKLGEAHFWQEVSELSGRQLLAMLPGQREEEYNRIKNTFFHELLDDTRTNLRKKSKTPGAGYKDDISLLRIFESFQRGEQIGESDKSMTAAGENNDSSKGYGFRSQGREWDPDYRERCQQFYDQLKDLEIDKLLIPLWMDRDSGIGAYIIGSDYYGEEERSGTWLALLELSDVQPSEDVTFLDVSFDKRVYPDYTIEELFDEYCNEIGNETGMIYTDVYQEYNDFTELDPALPIYNKNEVPVELQKYIRFPEDDAKMNGIYAAQEQQSLQEMEAVRKQGQACRQYMVHRMGSAAQRK